MAQNNPASARVVVVDHTNGIKARVVLPTNVRVGQLLPYLVKELGLPLEGPGQATVQYYLIHETEEGNVRLQEDQTLAQAGVHDDSVLRILFDMRAGTQTASPMRYFKLQMVDMEGVVFFETDFMIDYFMPFVRQLAAHLVEQEALRSQESYTARIIPRAGHDATFDRASLLKASDVPDDRPGSLDILFDKMEPPVDPVTYLTLQIRSVESNSAFRWDLRLYSQLRELLTRIVQALLDDGTLQDGEHFQFHVSAHAQGRPRLDPAVIVQKPAAAAILRPLKEKDLGEIKVPSEVTEQPEGEIKIVIESKEELIKPVPKSMASYTHMKPIGHISEQDIPIFVKKSAMDQAYNSGLASAQAVEEVGGFLLGNVFRDPDTQRLFVEISEAIEADEADGTAISLDFNYNAWRQVLDHLDQQHQNRVTVGWYHTHLMSRAAVIPVKEEENEYIAKYIPFLSEPDIFIHRNFFPDPWHVALVVDLHCKCNMFFSWQGGMILPTQGFYVYDELGGEGGTTCP